MGFQHADESLKDHIEVSENDGDEQSVLSALSKNLTIWDIASGTNAKDNLFIQKDIKGFEKDSFYIIKPNEYKSWHKAMAWYDLAEIKDKIEQAEIETLNEV